MNCTIKSDKIVKVQVYITLTFNIFGGWYCMFNVLAHITKNHKYPDVFVQIWIIGKQRVGRTKLYLNISRQIAATF